MLSLLPLDLAEIIYTLKDWEFGKKVRRAEHTGLEVGRNGSRALRSRDKRALRGEREA